MKNAFFTVLMLVMISACGGSAGEKTADFDFSLDPEGGSIGIEDVVSIEFPAGSFSENANLTISEMEDVDGYYREIYDATAIMFDAGISQDTVIRITSSAMPEGEADVRYTVSEEFLELLGDSFRPRLFAQLYQVGADDEELDYFVPLPFSLEGNILTTTLAPEYFTRLRNEDPSQGDYEAVLLLASSPRERVELERSMGNRSTKGMTNGDGCQASIIGNPLAGELHINRGGEFGRRTDPITGEENTFHRGIDLKANDGDIVVAAADGIVEAIRWNLNPRSGKGYGRYVVIRHNDGTKTLYAHFIKESTSHLRVGQTVRKGDQIGLADSSGGITGPHLHFEYAANGERYNDDSYIDPFPCIDANSGESGDQASDSNTTPPPSPDDEDDGEPLTITRLTKYPLTLKLGHISSHYAHVVQTCSRELCSTPGSMRCGTKCCVTERNTEETGDVYEYHIMIPFVSYEVVEVSPGNEVRIDLGDLLINGEWISAEYSLYIRVVGGPDDVLDPENAGFCDNYTKDTYWARMSIGFIDWSGILEIPDPLQYYWESETYSGEYVKKGYERELPFKLEYIGNIGSQLSLVGRWLNWESGD